MVYRNIYYMIKPSDNWNTSMRPIKYTGEIFTLEQHPDIRSGEFLRSHDYDPNKDIAITCSCVLKNYSGFEAVSEN